jgi:CHAD domain-containing protein
LKSRVSDDLVEELALLFDGLQHRRKAEHRKLARTLRSKAHQERMRQLQIALANPEPGPAANADVPAFAHAKVRRALKRMVKRGDSITPQTPDAVVHRFRIDTKKLRYNVDLFKCLLNDEAASSLIKRLKKLQDVLGRFNDLSVQQETSRAWALSQDNLPTSAALAIGALIGSMRAEQSVVRRKVETTFGAFDHRSFRSELDRMLEPLDRTDG